MLVCICINIDIIFWIVSYFAFNVFLSLFCFLILSPDIWFHLIFLSNKQNFYKKIKKIMIEIEILKIKKTNIYFFG
jgi:hypothetical protein